MLSYEICEILQNFIFTEHYWATASNFDQHFWRIACFISNTSIQSQFAVLELQKHIIHASDPQYLLGKYLK